MGPVIMALDAVRDGNIFGHEDMRLDSGSGGIGSESAGGISGGWNSKLLQSEMASHGDCRRESASFEGASRIKSLIFDENVWIFAAAQHGSKSFAECDRRGFGKDCIVSPHGRSERQERRGGKTFLYAGKIVACVEDSAILRANRLRTVRREMFAAARAFEVSRARHAESLSGESIAGTGILRLHTCPALAKDGAQDKIVIFYFELRLSTRFDGGTTPFSGRSFSIASERLWSGFSPAEENCGPAS